jgi:dTDP-glucose 4,6-dehydratase
MRVLVTGGCGFTGSAIVHALLRKGYRVLNMDRSARENLPEFLQSWADSDRHEVRQGDVGDQSCVVEVFEDFAQDHVVHCASTAQDPLGQDDPAPVLQTNFVGTFAMLEAARRWWAGRPGEHRFHHVSTSDVFGSGVGIEDRLSESAGFRPMTPFAASRAAADHLVQAWGDTYGLPVILSRGAANYGPWQDVSNMIPGTITRGADSMALNANAVAGLIGDWLHVDDHAEAVRQVMERGTPGETYNVGSGDEQNGAEVVRMICTELDEKLPRDAPHARRIILNEDTPAAVRRLSLDTSKINRDLGWEPQRTLRAGLAETVDWYLSNRWWWSSPQRASKPANRNREAA